MCDHGPPLYIVLRTRHSVSRIRVVSSLQSFCGPVLLVFLTPAENSRYALLPSLSLSISHMSLFLSLSHVSVFVCKLCVPVCPCPSVPLGAYICAVYVAGKGIFCLRVQCINPCPLKRTMPSNQVLLPSAPKSGTPKRECYVM